MGAATLLQRVSIVAVNERTVSDSNDGDTQQITDQSAVDHLKQTNAMWRTNRQHIVRHVHHHNKLNRMMELTFKSGFYHK